ncbi:MAG: undecaprenyl-phosphate glucose phosphotransferase [Chloroflexi bacterium]|uniref:Undecaprenyl-phosphate glucose phosphotransferase n=1 Tax=Candidatus Chlorohelix allophototropha TaxID=3003348 RepID=A0A8T7LRR8_9CHLR|nr:undecaprenyl-phosphate glucose phosphotransferase [Chloroflexota bacterium]WJW66576.1 undecaprenyl-phosphate glucose phosphotransferase [Chloroflexota bacterium L227-S17]
MSSQKSTKNIPSAGLEAPPVLPANTLLTGLSAAADASSGDTDLVTLTKYHKLAGDFAQIFGFITLVILDIAMITLGFVAAYGLRAKVPFGGPLITYSPTNYAVILPVSVATVLIGFYYRRLYRLKRGYSRIDEFYRICAAVTLGIILAIALNSVILGGSFQYSRQILLYSLVFIIVFTTLARFIFGAVLGFLRRKGVTQIRLLLVGSGEVAERIARKVAESPGLGYRVVGVLSDDLLENISKNLQIVGKLNDLREVVPRYHVDEVIIAISGASQDSLLGFVDKCEDLPVNIWIYPDAFQLITTDDGAIGELTGLPLLSVKDSSLRGVNRFIKRAMDVAISALILIFSSPLLLLQALLIKVTDPKGPVLYTQERVGLDGKPFTVLKFRSMRASSEKTGPGWTVKNDPRRTKIGTFMRRFSLDEMPQFINVLIGDMSIVGPRPEQVFKVEEFSQTYPRYSRRHKEKAGITGWAQVNGLRGDTSIEERIRYDLYYVENWSILFDIKIMLKTLIVIFTDKNAY